MTKVPVLTIDGPSGSGKGTVSRTAARALGWACSIVVHCIVWLHWPAAAGAFPSRTPSA